jgi:hypothetical protein
MSIFGQILFFGLQGFLVTCFTSLVLPVGTLEWWMSLVLLSIIVGMSNCFSELNK